MNSKEITVWLESRWCKALETQHGKPLEVLVDDYLHDLIKKLPESVYAEIKQELLQEEKQWQLEQEVGRRFAVFHVIEKEQHSYFQVERNLEILDTARLVRKYLRHGRCSIFFSEIVQDAEPISPTHFEALIGERLENTGRICGAFELNFDTAQFSALHIMNGWMTYRMKDVTAAAYHADRKAYIQPTERWNRFLEKLEGKELKSESAV